MNFPTSVPINYSNSSTFYPDATGQLGSFTKSPDAQTMVSLDYTEFLPTGITIVNVAFILNYGTAPQLLVSGGNVQANGEILSFLVSGGVNGVKYVIQIQATLSDAQTVNIQYLEVVVAAPGVPASNCGPMMPQPMPISNVFQQAQILNGDGSKFASTFVVFWVSDIAPTTANILDRWYNTSDGLIYDRATDGNTVFWVSSSARPTQYTTGPNAPGGPYLGDVWYDTGNSALNMWMNNGTGNQWIPIG